MSSVDGIEGNTRAVSYTVSWVAHYISNSLQNPQEMNIVQSYNLVHNILRLFDG